MALHFRDARPLKDQIMAYRFDQQSQRLALVTRTFKGPENSRFDSTVCGHIFDLSENTLRPVILNLELRPSRSLPNAIIQTADISHDLSHFLIGDNNWEATLIPVDEPAQKRTFTTWTFDGEGSFPTCRVAFISDGHRLIKSDVVLEIRQMKDLSYQVKEGHTINGFCFDKEGDYLLYSHSDAYSCVRSLEDLAVIIEFDRRDLPRLPEPGRFKLSAMSPDHQALILVFGNRVSTVSLNDGALLNDRHVTLPEDGYLTSGWPYLGVTQNRQLQFQWLSDGQDIVHFDIPEALQNGRFGGGDCDFIARSESYLIRCWIEGEQREMRVDTLPAAVKHAEWVQTDPKGKWAIFYDGNSLSLCQVEGLA